MLWHPQDAEDATQEILFKVVTSVATFRGESSFRTWALRVATNHLLNLEAVGEMEHLHAIAGIHQSHPRYRAPEA